MRRRRSRAKRRTPLRVFHKEPETWGLGTLCLVRLLKASVTIETREAQFHGARRPRRTRRAHRDPSAGRESFARVCAKKLAEGWTEILADLDRQRIGTPPFHDAVLSNDERLDLIETAWLDRPPPKRAPAPPRDRSAVVARLVSGKATGARLVPAGTLRLTSGKVVACDPYHLSDTAPCAELPPGEYAVVLTVIGRVVAAATIVAAAPQPTRWEIMTNVAIDVGTGAFLDDAVVAVLEDDDRGFLEAIGRARGPNATVRSFGRAGNAIAFPTAQGDGSHEVWVGRRGKAVTRITLDFGLPG